MTLGAVLWCVGIAAEAAALAGAVRTLRRTPVVALLAFGLASDVLASAGGRWLLDGASRPFAGLARGWYHVETALVLGWPVALATAAWCVLVLPSRWYSEPAPALAWGAGLGGLVLLVSAHPAPRGLVATVLLAVEAVSVAVAWLAVARGWRRPWGAAQMALVLLIPVETVVLILGPFGRDVFRDWPTLARIPYAVGFASVAAVLWRARRVSP